MQNEISTETFIGSNKIKEINPSGEVTPKGKEIFCVEYTSGKKEFYVRDILDVIITDTPSDASKASQKRVEFIIDKVFNDVLKEFDARALDMESIARGIIMQFDNHLNRAENYLWTKNDKEYVPGFNPMYERSLFDAERINNSIPKDESIESPFSPDTTENN
jgi:hypothetical protein